MPTFLMTIAALVLLAGAAYAQVRIARFTAGVGNAMLARAVLIVTGIAFGYVSATLYPLDPAHALLNFLIGFGVVHFPAAFILFLKHARHTGKS